MTMSVERLGHVETNVGRSILAAAGIFARVYAPEEPKSWRQPASPVWRPPTSSRAQSRPLHRRGFHTPRNASHPTRNPPDAVSEADRGGKVLHPNRGDSSRHRSRCPASGRRRKVRSPACTAVLRTAAQGAIPHGTDANRIPVPIRRRTPDEQPEDTPDPAPRLTEPVIYVSPVRARTPRNWRDSSRRNRAPRAHRRRQ